MGMFSEDRSLLSFSGQNPNPENFSILRTRQVGKCVVVEAHYPDCQNFEGKKIMVFSNTTEDEMKKRKKIDPHFQMSSGPIARFEPTDVGWKLAVQAASTFESICEQTQKENETWGSKMNSEYDHVSVPEWATFEKDPEGGTWTVITLLKRGEVPVELQKKSLSKIIREWILKDKVIHALCLKVNGHPGHDYTMMETLKHNLFQFFYKHSRQKWLESKEKKEEPK